MLLATLAFVALLLPLPYVIFSPGPTENTLGTFKGHEVIQIEGPRTYPVAGHLELTTVSENAPEYKPKLGEVLKGWVSSTQLVLPRDIIYPPGTSVQQANHKDKTDMLDSQSAAVAAGIGAAGFAAFAPTVTAVDVGSPAKGKLQAGDAIVAVDGRKTPKSSDVVNIVSALNVGSSVVLTVRRDYVERTVQVSTIAAPGPKTSRIGIGIRDQFNPPFKVTIDLGQPIGGPSAGLIFSLGVYDKLTPGALTGGRFVAGTGTIDQSGNVGPIGGIQQKIAGAEANGATVFLVPAANCGEATQSGYAHKVHLIKVSTMTDAVDALHALDKNDLADVPSC